MTILTKQLIEIAVEFFGVSFDELSSKGRSNRIFEPKICIVKSILEIGTDITPIDLSDIGVDNQSLRYYKRRFPDIYSTDKRFKLRYDKFVAMARERIVNS